MEAAPGSYKTNLSAANNTVFLTQQDWDRAVAETGRALAILDPLPDLENVGIAYQQAGVFYRNLGLRLASSNPAGRGEARLRVLVSQVSGRPAAEREDRTRAGRKESRGKRAARQARTHLRAERALPADGPHLPEAGRPEARGGSLRTRPGAGIRSRPSGRACGGISRGRRHSKGRHGAGGGAGRGFPADAIGDPACGTILARSTRRAARSAAKAERAA